MRDTCSTQETPSLLAAAENGGPPSQAVMDCVNEKAGHHPPKACGDEHSITCTHDCIQALADIQAQLDGSCCELATEWTPAYCRKQITRFNGNIQGMRDTCSTQETPSLLAAAENGGALSQAGVACVGGVLGAVAVLAVAGSRKRKFRGEPLLPPV